MERLIGTIRARMPGPHPVLDAHRQLDSIFEAYTIDACTFDADGD
jgi:hypothetical protein